MSKVASLVTMTIEHVEEQGDTVIVYKRDRSNAFGTVDLNGISQQRGRGNPPSGSVVPEIREVGRSRLHHGGWSD